MIVLRKCTIIFLVTHSLVNQLRNKIKTFIDARYFMTIIHVDSNIYLDDILILDALFLFRHINMQSTYMYVNVKVVKIFI